MLEMVNAALKAKAKAIKIGLDLPRGQRLASSEIIGRTCGV